MQGNTSTSVRELPDPTYRPSLALSAKVCDRLGCPASVVHRVYVHGQDFYFCNHHWIEVAAWLPPHAVAESGPQVDGHGDPLEE